MQSISDDANSLNEPDRLCSCSSVILSHLRCNGKSRGNAKVGSNPVNAANMIT